MPKQITSVSMGIGPGETIDWRIKQNERVVASVMSSGSQEPRRRIPPGMERFEEPIVTIAKAIQQVGQNTDVEYFGEVVRIGATTKGLCRAEFAQGVLLEYFWDEHGGPPVIEMAMTTSQLVERVAALESIRGAMTALIGEIEQALEETRVDHENGARDSSP